jgi:hypothetical protein
MATLPAGELRDLLSAQLAAADPRMEVTRDMLKLILHSIDESGTANIPLESVVGVLIQSVVRLERKIVANET